MLSLVIPCRNEGVNVVLLADRTAAALKGIDYEVLFIDASTDDTGDFLRAAAEKHTNVDYIFAPELNLAGAVVLGMRSCRGDVIGVMDADLQHPPELLPTMYTEIRRGADLVAPSRLIEGGSEEGLNIFRRFTSWAARKAGQVALSRVRDISDPTSGFFMVRRSVVDGVDLNPIGWKILMEIIVKGNYRTVREIPYTFGKRAHGVSKFGIREQWNYIRHIGALTRYDREGIRPFLFGLVGLSGTALNLSAFSLFNALHNPVLLSAIYATSLAVFSNYRLNSSLTWGDVRGEKAWHRGVKYISLSTISLGINLTLLGALAVPLGRMPADVIGVIGAMGINYFLQNKWTFARTEKKLLAKEGLI